MLTAATELCSVQLETPATRADSAKSAIDGPLRNEGERRQLTVLFCDLVGFTELASRLDPEVLQQIMRSDEDVCAVCVVRFEGYVFQILGDRIVAFFGYPLAHAGEAERAIHAGLAIIESLAGLNVPDVGRLQVRIGIATGPVVVSSAEKGAVGETMNLASRLQGVVQPGSIVISERVHLAEILRIRGAVRERIKDLAGAEKNYLASLNWARKQQAKSRELRTSISLARSWQQQGKRKVAHDHLAAVYNWFTEGFDTKDLKEPNALIEELA